MLVRIVRAWDHLDIMNISVNAMNAGGPGMIEREEIIESINKTIESLEIGISLYELGSISRDHLQGTIESLKYYIDYLIHN
jgi:hypothetical protein